MLFTAHGTINIKNKKWEDDFSAFDEMGTHLLIENIPKPI
jgi:queuine tRNA-ribosyltransferase